MVVGLFRVGRAIMALCVNALECSSVTGALDASWQAVLDSGYLDACLQCEVFARSAVAKQITSMRDSGSLVYLPESRTYAAEGAWHDILSAAIEALMLDEYATEENLQTLESIATRNDKGTAAANPWECVGSVSLFADDRADLPMMTEGDMAVEQMLQIAGLRPPEKPVPPSDLKGYPDDRPWAWGRRYDDRTYRLKVGCPLLVYPLALTERMPEDDGAPLARRKDDEVCGTLQLDDTALENEACQASKPTPWTSVSLSNGNVAFRIGEHLVGAEHYMGVSAYGEVGLVATLFEFRPTQYDELVVAQPNHPLKGKALGVDFEPVSEPPAPATCRRVGRIRWPGRWCGRAVSILNVGAPLPD